MEMMIIPKMMRMFMISMPTNAMRNLSAHVRQGWGRVVAEESMMMLMIPMATDTMGDLAFFQDGGKMDAGVGEVMRDIAEVKVVVVFMVAFTANAVRDAVAFLGMKLVNHG
jgi:hypothetical protein